MSRRKHLTARTPAGQPRRIASDSRLLPPTELRRLLDAAAAGIRDPAWGSQLGRIYLGGKVSATEYAAGKRWAELVVDYSHACRSPAQPKTISFDTPGGTPIDPDSEKGEREVRRHKRTSAAWLDGRDALRRAGSQAERVVDGVCVQDQAPAGLDEFNALRNGLQALSTLWTTKRKAGAR